jgi:hypothetical protein
LAKCGSVAEWVNGTFPVFYGLQSEYRGVSSPAVTPKAPHLAGLFCVVLLGLVGAGYQRRTMSVVPLDPTEIHRLRDRYLRLTFDKAGRLVASENGTKTGD